MSDLQQLLLWIQVNQNEWLTEYGNEQLAHIFVRHEDERSRQYRARVNRLFSDLLRDAPIHPIVHLDRFGPARYIDFILTLHRARNNVFLSKSSYGNKRAALFHLFRLHNRTGFNEAFKAELTNLFKGLYRQVAQNRRDIANNFVDGEDAVNGNNFLTPKEGRSAMSVKLYRALCDLFLKFGTNDGVFAYCYLVLTWNLACRCNNTSRIKFINLNWSQSFDSFSTMFATTKTDQLGDASRYPRHIYANPFSPLVCPVVAIGIYLTTCFGHDIVPTNSYFFPGEFQDARFANIMRRTVDENWDLISRMGYQRGDVGTHSIRKGAVSYLASLPGGPPDGSISTRAGWTMGKVKDLYIKYIAPGDQFVGRCLSLLSLLRPDFAASPPVFANENDNNWIDDTRKEQFIRIACGTMTARLVVITSVSGAPSLKGPTNPLAAFAIRAVRAVVVGTVRGPVELNKESAGI